MDDFLAKKRPVPVLTQDNHERWFKLLERYFKGEGIWAAVIGTPMADREGLEKADAKAQYIIDICIDDMDRERVEACKDAKEMWDMLKKKYSDKRPSVGRQYLHELVTYRMPEDGNIQDAWTDIQRLARMVKTINPAMKDAFDQTQMFQQLLASLPSTYDAIRDAIDGQGEKDVDILFQRLLEKESSLKNSEKAFAARTRPERTQSPRPQKSSNAAPYRPPQARQKQAYGLYKCFACKGEHKWRQCPFIEDHMDEIRKILTKARSDRRGKDRAHAAMDLELSSEDSAASSDEEITGARLECEPPSPQWIADTGATAHMTDQLHLFRGPLKMVGNKSVQVGGNTRLRIEGAGQVQVQTKGGVMNLSNVLYVPDLGVNLLSGAALCNMGLQGSFDKRALYMHDKNGSLILKAVKQNGIYIVNRIAKGLQSVAFPASVQQHLEAQVDNPADPLTGSNDTSPESKGRSRYLLWHKRFAHMGEQKLKNLHQVTTLQRAIHKPKIMEPCEVCALTKMRNRTNGHVSERKSHLLDLVSIDICGPLPKALSGARYFLEIVDNHTRKVWVIPLRDRTEAKLALETWRRSQELASGSRLKAMRTDNGGELKSTLDEWGTEIGIQPQYTVPYTSSQNGVAERNIQTTENNTRAMLKEAGLPVELWDEAAMTDAYLRNRTDIGPEIDDQRITPEEAWTGEKPSIDHIRVWGCKCYSYVNPKSLPPKGRQDKLMDRGRVAVFVGYEENTIKQFRIYAPDLGYVTRTSVIIFNESQKGGTVDLRVRTTPNTLPDRKPRGRPRKDPAADAPIPSRSEIDPEEDHITADANRKPGLRSTNPDEASAEPGTFLYVEIPRRQPTPEPAPEPESPSHPTPQAERFSHVEIPRQSTSTDQPETHDQSPPDSPEPSDGSVYQPDNPTAAPADRFLPEAPPVTGKRDREGDEDEDGLDLRSRKIHRAYPVQYRVPIPKTYREAIGDPTFGAEWVDAINREKDALQMNGTWEETVPPPDANVISSRWVFDVKYAENGGIDKFKARLVARGFSQRYGIDYQDTFAPTMRMDSFRVLLALVAVEDLECHQVDVNNAFTESVNTETIYMSPPDGIRTAKGRVLKILKSLYGLKQAARDWYNCLSEGLLQLGFQPTPADPCIFTNGKGIIIGTWVDDLAIAGPNLPEIIEFKRAFGQIFKIKDLGEMKKILGIKITRNRRERTLFLSQEAYIDKIISDLKMEQDSHKAVTFPISGYEALVPATEMDERVNVKVYQQFIGSVTYAMTISRPDIAFTTNKLAQYLSDPAKHHQQAVKRLVRYLRSTKAMRIRYGPETPNLTGYSDADYGGDKSDRKSTTGNVFLLAGGAVSWLSRKQRSVSTSTTEAEYVALSTCAKQAVWLAQLLRDIGYAQYLGDSPWTTNLRGDNQSSLALVRNPQIQERSKHIDICYHNIRDREKRGQIKIDYVCTAEMAADGLTKPLTGSSFESSVSLLGLSMRHEMRGAWVDGSLGRMGKRQSEDIAEIRVQGEC